jgi:hypothetical protein
LLSAVIKDHKSHGGNNQYGNSHHRADSKRPPLFIDRGYHLPGHSSILFDRACLLAKVLNAVFVPQLPAHAGQ